MDVHNLGAINMSLLAELKDSLLSEDSGDMRNALTMHNLIAQLHNLGSNDFSRFRLGLKRND